MGKVSIGLRGWRFDEDAVFDADGRIRPLGNMDEDTRERIVRLSAMMGEPCDACYLVHGDEDIERCNPAQAIYGEPLGEVLLCDDHEADFVYWFQEEGGKRLAGERELQGAFHDWFADGGRSPEGFELEHVEEDPDSVPEAPDPDDELPGLEEEIEEMDDEELDALDLDLTDLDIE
ncbi:hypothetical protein ACFQMA_17550 [Halosimplex aquaticum]|uniref:Uncharacterized protein n=1 Tax=Halosimplex aquaticum TaxID=3026162 RepID=A0ABD5Y2T6_9EURY|nr:hypothetical protein [Halosimplex aquaticum]